jgi:hypothetical protein
MLLLGGSMIMAGTVRAQRKAMLVVSYLVLRCIQMIQPFYRVVSP